MNANQQGLVCPKCECPETKVIKTRDGRIRGAIDRRRECEHCGYRWWTRESSVLRPRSECSSNEQ